MTRPLVIETHTPNGEVRTADLLTSIAKRLRDLADPSFNLRRRISEKEQGAQIGRVEEMRRLAAQLDRLAATLEGKQ